MKKSFVLIIIFLMAFMLSLPASEKPAKSGKTNGRTECKAKSMVYFYPTVKAKKHDANYNRKAKKHRNRSRAFPV
jgi:hypothetical protein